MVECLAGELVRFLMRFTIRDLLWLTVVVGTAAGWFVHVRTTREMYSRRDHELRDKWEAQLKEIRQIVREDMSKERLDDLREQARRPISN
jgi:hypothetical protein